MLIVEGNKIVVDRFCKILLMMSSVVMFDIINRRDVNILIMRFMYVIFSCFILLVILFVVIMKIFVVKEVKLIDKFNMVGEVWYVWLMRGFILINDCVNN